jgi:hypothetical protein
VIFSVGSQLPVVVVERENVSMTFVDGGTDVGDGMEREMDR